ncbi:SDR family oxidoreductase [Phytomonospora sp. NPDC050363]|uniref:SDR family NAD(P)-dependent oxidoreductase n=1 Tax=Phytomonospora sp. NPDC050363 TaxID=3155642 RepID=UPI0033E40D8E
MDLGLAGKTAVVTGGSKGIGLAVVRTLIAEGVRVVTGSRGITPELKETAAVPVTVDLSTPEGATELIERATIELGGIDILVNNVGIGDMGDFALGGFLDLPEAAWTHNFDLHFYSALRVSRAALPGLVERKGALVNISSIGARVPGDGPIAYNVSKSALTALGKVLAAEFGPQGVRVNTVSPGPVSTGVWTDPAGFSGVVADSLGIPHDAFVAGALERMAPDTGRLTTPEEVARTVAFLLSPNNLSGADVLLDGGILKQV